MKFSPIRCRTKSKAAWTHKREMWDAKCEREECVQLTTSEILSNWLKNCKLKFSEFEPAQARQHNCGWLYHVCAQNVQTISRLEKVFISNSLLSIFTNLTNWLSFEFTFAAASRARSFWSSQQRKSLNFLCDTKKAFGRGFLKRIVSHTEQAERHKNN